MKNLLLLLALLCFPLFLIAQNLNGSFKIDIDGGYVKPTEGYGVTPGVVLTLEPRVYISDYFTAGLRLEGALIGYRPEYEDEYFSYFGSTTLTGEYYFGKGKNRPFMGFGGGLYARHFILEDYSGESLYTSDYGRIKLGFFGRAGVELGHIRLAGSYNVIGANFSYAAFTIGYVIGE